MGKHEKHGLRFAVSARSDIGIMDHGMITMRKPQ